MSSRDQIQVKQITLTPQQMQTAMAKAAERVKTMVVWQDRRPAHAAQTKSQGK